MSALINIPKTRSLASPVDMNFLPISHWMDEMLNTGLSSVFSSNFNTGITLPKVNIKEIADAYEVEMAVPGHKKTDFQIDLENQILSISTDINEDETSEENESKGTYTRREFGYSSFKRSFTLPETVDDRKIDATYKDGLLRIILPKKEEAKQKPPRTIKIS